MEIEKEAKQRKERNRKKNQKVQSMETRGEPGEEGNEQRKRNLGERKRVQFTEKVFFPQSSLLWSGQKGRKKKKE